MSLRFVLIGHPVGHSISPAIHGRAYRLLDVEAEYGLADCPDEAAVRAQVDKIRSGELTGANVTVPWKQLAFDLADEHDQSARDVGVANVLTRTSEGKIVAHNTDATALGAELKSAVAASGVNSDGRPAALVIGSGGAALAAVVGCRLAGVSEIMVTARRFDPEEDEETWPRAAHFKQLGARLVAWSAFDPRPLAEALTRTHLVVQATSAGMKGTAGGEALAEMIPWSELPPLVAYDLVYTPPVTPFLEHAEQAGHAAVGGLGMLVGQAVHAIAIWLGPAPRSEELAETARKALGL